jgi:inositol polyphosphate 5-phosphatase INPP5B/F
VYIHAVLSFRALMLRLCFISQSYRPTQNAVCKPWLTVTPKFGMIIPGEKPTTMEFSLTISKETAQMLNSGRESLDDILILRLEGGRDYYITVKGSFARSCFGMTVDELVLYAEPIRSVPLDPIEQAKIKPKPAATALCVPKELWRTIDAIFEKGLHAPHLFVESGIPNEIRSVRESLDTGAPFQGQFSIHSYAEVLITFLSSLAVPVVTQGMIPANEIDSQTIQISARRLLEELPPIHYNVFVYVISFFREVLAFRERNHLTAAKVARICCRAFCGDAFDESGEGKRTGMQLVILHLLETTSI